MRNNKQVEENLNFYPPSLNFSTLKFIAKDWSSVTSVGREKEREREELTG